MSENNDSVHSADIQEIVSKIPSWIVRWGTFLISAVLLMTMSIAAIVRYPDCIVLPLKLEVKSSSNTAIALVEVNQKDFMRIRMGQRVLVQLLVFNSTAYAAIIGKVIEVADTPNKNEKFTVIIELMSTSKTPIKLKNWMIGNAQIITDDISVLQRISNNFSKQLKI